MKYRIEQDTMGEVQVPEESPKQHMNESSTEKSSPVGIFAAFFLNLLRKFLFLGLFIIILPKMESIIEELEKGAAEQSCLPI